MLAEHIKVRQVGRKMKTITARSSKLGECFTDNVQPFWFQNRTE